VVLAVAERVFRCFGSGSTRKVGTAAGALASHESSSTDMPDAVIAKQASTW